MSMDPRELGGPIKEFWEDPGTIQQLESVQKWLMKNAKKHVASEPPTAKSLAQLVQQFIQLQEELLGRKAKNPPFTRLPVHLFYDFSPNGSLCHILAALYRFKTVQGWRRFDLSSPSRRDPHMLMCSNVEKALIDQDLYKPPVVFLKDNLRSSDKKKVTALVMKRGGQMTKNEREATHIIHPKIEGNPDLYCRPVFSRGDKCLVHFIALPDSSDNWGVCYPEHEVDETAREKADQYHVGVDWVSESEQYNEWMNEEDFEQDGRGNLKESKMAVIYEELENSEEKPDKKKKSASKRKRSPSPTPTKRKSKGGSKSNRSRVDSDDEDDLTANISDPAPENNISEVKQNFMNIGKSDMQPGKGGTYVDVGGSGGDGSGDEGEKKENDDNVTEQTHHIIVSSYSEAHTRNILALIKEDINALISNDTPDMIVICKDDEIVQTQKNLLCMFSSTLRTMLGSVLNMETFMVFMPDYKKATVQKVIRMLRFEWKEEEFWDSEVVQLLQGLNINVGHFQVRKTGENTTLVAKGASPSSQPASNGHQVVEQDESTSFSNKQKPFPNYSVRKKFEKRDVKCPSCPRVFTGTVGRLKDMLRCHLGNIHFQNEISVEVKNYFGNGVKCNECNKVFQSATSKKKHLTFNHTIFVDKILSIVTNAVDDDHGSNPNEFIQDPTLPQTPLRGEEELGEDSTEIEKLGTEHHQFQANNSVVGVVINENIDDIENNHDTKKQLETYDDDVDSLLQSDDEKETDEIQKLLLADVSDDDESDVEDSDTEEVDENIPSKDEQESNFKALSQDTEMSEIDIQNQLLRDQDLSDSDDEASTDELEQEEVDNISYEEVDNISYGSEKNPMDDRIQDDAELIQRNLLLDQDISDDDDDY